jgi:FkbM family methyltransferase
MSTPLQKLIKAVRLLADARFRPALLMGVAATIEHAPAFEGRQFRAVIDIGANKGQFTLLMAGLNPAAQIVAFEPLPDAFATLQSVTGRAPRIRAINAAIGPVRAKLPIYVSRQDDSSSLLPITSLQERIFPNTDCVRTEQVAVAPLADFVALAELPQPCLLKIDVQGYELQALEGCGDGLDHFSMIYVEASFVQLYRGQAYADEVIDLLHSRGFRLVGIYNISQTAEGHTVQADFLFERRPRRNVAAQAASGERPAMIAS